eukprot:TRINITY_DN6649_c0_g2_i4.p1 TRINITY_DN6649_c0_g2~~TRINITY_DN6649_c0_g2_i4.p1  ORF type:complete len:380 (-),score=103.25 TRINITY_DN6649_c0_g2_i4:274-1323(-)
MTKEKDAQIQELKSRADSAKNDESSDSNVKELTGKLDDLAQENCDLRAEVSQLQRFQEENKAAHEKEVKRLKKASDMVISEYRDSNFKLREMTGRSMSPESRSSSKSRPGPSKEGQQDSSFIAVTITESSQLLTDNTDADESDADSSLLACTPVVRRPGGGGRTAAAGRRGAAGGSRARKNAATNATAPVNIASGSASTRRSRAALRLSQASASSATLPGGRNVSFEDSNTENEPEQVSASARKKVTRKPRVAKTRNISFQDAHPSEPESAKKRVLRERQALNNSNGREQGSDSEFLLPTLSTKKKRRLYSTTPQISEVFTPPTDTEETGASPHSIAKRQLRSRRSKRK